MSRDHRNMEKVALFRNIFDLGLSTIMAIVLPLIILGYVIAIGLILIPLGFFLPVGIGCGIIHTVIIVAGLLTLAIPRLLLKIRESRLKKEIEALPEEERIRMEIREIALLLLAMGYTPENGDGSVMMIGPESIVDKGTCDVEITYRDFSKPMGWAYFKGKAEVSTTDSRYIFVTSGDNRKSISYFTEVLDEKDHILLERRVRGSGRRRIDYTNRSGRRILSKVTPTVRTDEKLNDIKGKFKLETLLDILSDHPDIMEEGRKQRELLSIWIR